MCSYMYMLYVLYNLSSEQQRCWSDCVDVQADLHILLFAYG